MLDFPPHDQTGLAQPSNRTSVLPMKLSFEGALLSLLGLMELFVGLEIWSVSTQVPYSNVISLVVIGSGLILSVLALTTRVLKTHKVVELFVVALFVFSFAAWVYSRVYGNPYYGTDEIAFDQYAAQLFIQHIDPYGANLAPSFDLFQVPIIYHTYTVTGEAVNLLSYPAMAFLPYVPLLLIGIHAQAAVYVDTAFWLLAILMLYFVLPRPYKPISLLIGLSFTYMNYVVGGVTDALFLPFLLLAAWRWDRFEEESEGLARWIGPIGLGLAMSIKQTAWFLAPFVVLAIYKEKDSLRPALKYLVISAVAFLVPNIPFIIWNWRAWLRGIMAPLDASTVPSGQGLINLTMLEHLGGGDLSFYSYAALALLFALLVSVALNFGVFKRLIFIIPSLVLFFPTRSFASYLIDLFPVLLLSALTVQRHNHETLPRNSRRKWTVLAYVPFVIFTIWGISVPAPLRMQITGVHTTGELQTIDRLNVTVENRSSRTETPHFTLTEAPQITSFWHVASGPRTLRPGEVATYTIESTNVPSMPTITGGFLVDAFTTSPVALSTTRIYRANKMHTSITPQSINKTVPLHRKITLEVQLYDPLGRPIMEPGVTVNLGQVVYGQNGLYAGETSINGEAEGKTPVSTVTNKAGVARFSIEAVQYQNAPVYFQAFIQPHGEFPFGYSQIVSIRFGN